ncbi:endonuclease/exonuclease/phosphatase family protein [Olleya aquimaris]|uniref:Endonuclease/Exonuclease/phosphatase family protein n=1 Tax=Olleya aquimaris TaxID=639310 RepID=A0A327RQU1_9FLAO|nr:endonuclease/exonuclease/phosphatase family protein [Olleya aquimaris]RAJ18034.1 Endonuclease/Exonuclease/phosphatase family protein [Olleya aquimaris]
MKFNLFKSKTNKQTVAFYNIENLFDIYKNELTRDLDFNPTSEKRWTVKRYNNKLRKIGYAISNIGRQETNTHPAIIGLAEIENEAVIKDLLASKHLAKLPYNYVHYDSKDERGIDVALLYDHKKFSVLHSEIFEFSFHTEDDIDHTRDILWVKGLFLNEEVNFIVNHWPSRRAGNNETEHKRQAAAAYVEMIISKIKTDKPDAKIVVMGDFNDDPSSKSVRQLVSNQGLFNPMETLISIDRGTTVHNFEWNLFDQIIISHNFFERKAKSWRYVKANIFDPDFLKQSDGKYKGTPYRTYVGKRYKGGYSDHFPVYMILKKK